MIISYPILPAGADTGDEDARLTSFLSTYVDNASGFYPVSFEDRWHGGIHLKPGAEPLRAIADGEVVCYRVAAQAETYPDQGDYDTSFVLLKHSTETGENTPVVFYSLLMHLLGRSKQTAAQQKQLPDWLQKATPAPDVKPGNGQKVWRKDVLGFAGQYMGEERVHFEIFATDTDLGHFWKDSTAIAAGGHGSDDFFGDAGFVIPAGSNFSAAHPHAAAIRGVLAAPQETPVAGSNADSPATAPTTPTFDPSLAGNSPQGQATSGEIYVSVRFDRGTRIATSYRKLPSGKFVQIGQPLREAEYEYKLYKLATKLYTDCPSAGYEWLRFGRVLGPDTTATQENWQLIRYDDTKSGYIDLAASTITKLSDADFPFWLGWQKISEGTAIDAQDGLCDVPKLLELLHGNAPATSSTPSLTEAKKDFIAHATAQGVAEALRFAVAQHPSEWDDSDLENRYAKERQPGKDLADDKSWNDFKDHVKKMAFWTNTGIDRSAWHFHPVQFIKHYRCCGWLSLNEVSQLMPRKHGLNSSKMAAITWSTANSRFRNRLTDLNKTIRKYGLVTSARTAHFLAQTYIETATWSTMRELGRAHQQKHKDGTLYWPAPAMEYYGAFYGRGIMQLTWASNYEAYGDYRSFPDFSGSSYQDQRITQTSLHYWSDPRDKHGKIVGKPSQWSPRYDPEDIADNNYNACDSGGHYWISKNIGSGNININRVCDQGITPAAVGRASVLVNGGGYGYNERQQFAAFIKRFISDTIEKSANEKITSPRGGTVYVDYTPQRP